LTLAEVGQHLRARNRTFKRISDPDYRVERYTGVRLPDPQRTGYECNVSLLGDAVETGYCVFQRNRLEKVTLLLTGSAAQYDEWKELKTLYERLSQRLGTLPRIQGSKMIWKTRDGTIEVSSKSEFDGNAQHTYFVIVRF
jgi:hypothetical protein